MHQNWTPLSREEVIKTIERKNPIRIPLVMAKWWGEGLVEKHGNLLSQFDSYPEDVGMLWIRPLETSQMKLSWSTERTGALDSAAILDDWDKLDEFIDKMPDPEKDPQFDQLKQKAEKYHAENRYILFAWWRLFFERPWEIRGMENLLMDYYLEPEKIHRLHTALCRLYTGYLKRAKRELEPDGFFTSDDLGHQTQPMMRPEIFDEFIKPYYCKIGASLKTNQIHWWLHSCGNNTPLLPALIEAGVQVFHPVQKGTMDEIAVARQYGDNINFLVGIDVQHTLQEKDAAEVREEVRFLIETFDRSDGGMCLAAGNGIVPGTPLENIKAFLEEALEYGTFHRKKFCL
ncbi:methylcobamide--CoM methyltransferase [candidate division KSB1 bacterium]|nr:methylcobamide--CoM methyltransferase [candidate division KSB1 bacterium]